MTGPAFDGVTYQAELDGKRLTTQLEAVLDVMGTSGWMSLASIAAEVSARLGRPATEAAVSARLRDLRKVRHGGHLVERKRDDQHPGLWLYRLGPAGHYTDEAPSGRPAPVSAEPTGMDLVESWATRHHPHAVARACPGCGQDATVHRLTDLAYTFDTCTCGTPGYDHLVEQLWHLDCLGRHLEGG